MKQLPGGCDLLIAKIRFLIGAFVAADIAEQTDVLLFFEALTKEVLTMRRALFVSSLALSIALTGLAQQPVGDAAVQQVTDLLRMKSSFTRAQQKESTELIWAGKRARNESFGSVPALVVRRVERSDGAVLVDLKVKSIAPVVSIIQAVGGRVVSSHAPEGYIRAMIPALSIDTVAGNVDVQWMRAADIGVTNFIGSVTSQGYVTHTANQSVALGFDGTGTRVGVLSDSASPARVAALIASGDLPPDVVVVPGQVGTGADEGAAMMEIVHDLAPGAKLFFATALGGQANFGNNIRTLRFTYGCDVIVDDFTYFAEGVFQDGTIAKAVNDVTANGALYFSSAANSGNVDSGTAGTWEGDFQNGGPAGFPIDVIEGTAPLHNFGTASTPVLYDTLTGTGTNGIYLKWSDPLSASGNDYDLFVFDSTGTVLKGFSINPQTGTQDPVEAVNIGINCGTSSALGYCPALGDRIVVVLFRGVERALHLDTERGRLSIATQGATFGHNAGLNTVSMAATYWNSAHLGTVPFTGPDNPIEIFSSDGPRRIFYNPDGTAITPGNLLFSTDGGTVLQKPDLTAADGVFTATPGFLPFFGTSAAAPHAAAIAALVKSVNPLLTNGQIKQVMLDSTVDNMAPGVDRDSGFGIVMALQAVQNALRPLQP
ncbi:MAG: S8 family serine peptidase [Acidobacteriaceae bacterium]|nr:S8 family serine peptidase [Acidobacteriaceae bacterium]